MINHKLVDELEESFGPEMATKYQEFDGYWSIDWKEGPTETITGILKDLGIEFEVYNIGDADLVFYKKNKYQMIGEAVLKMMEGDYSHTEMGVNLEGMRKAIGL